MTSIYMTKSIWVIRTTGTRCPWRSTPTWSSTILPARPSPMRAATFPIPLRDIQKTEVGTAVTKELAIQGSSVDSAKTVLAKWIWESRYEEVERAYSLVTAVRFLNAKNGVDYKFSLHFLPGLWYTAYGISAMQFQPFVCN